MNSSEYVLHVLQENSSNYSKGFIYERLKPFIGLGLLTSDGDLWRCQRKLIQPAFHKQRIAPFADLIVERTQHMLDGWASEIQPGALVDVHEEMKKLTLNIVADALFGAELGDEAHRWSAAFTDALEVTNARCTSLVMVPQIIPTPRNIRFRRAMRTLGCLIEDMIRKKQASTRPATDLLSMLLEARDDSTEGRMTDKQVRDEILTTVFAGHETTANVLSWSFLLLSRHPAAAETLRNELASVLGERAPALDDIARLRYMSMLLQESMRLYPPVWLIARKAIADDEVGGVRIPAGSTVILSPYMMHRHPRYWARPAEFDPSRFDSSVERPKGTYFPFALGPRMCLGSGLAMMEMPLILAMVLQRFTLELDANCQVRPLPVVTLRPSALRMKLTPVVGSVAGSTHS